MVSMASSPATRDFPADGGGVAERLAPVSLPRNLWLVEVAATRRIASRMQRITLHSPRMAEMPDGPNIKLMIPPTPTSPVAIPQVDPRGRPVWPDPATRPALRTYSVRSMDRHGGFLDVDFVLHGHAGPAANWAANVRPGAQLIVGGPGGRMMRPAASYVLAADLSALPALSRVLEDLPQDARGVAFIEAFDESDRIELRHPPGVRVEWLFTRSPQSPLPEAVRNGVDWPAHAGCFLWVAGESDAVRAIRAFGRDVVGLDRRMILAIGYWRRGMSEDAYHEAHDNDRDADYHAVWQEERNRDKHANG
jgi:NADPH-dependent ferric siderophore reductase